TTVRLLLARGDTANAETKLATLEAKVPVAAAALDAIHRLADTVKATEESIRAMKDLGDADRRGLLDVSDTERDWLGSMTDAAYPDPDAGKDSRAEKTTWINGFHEFVGLYQEPEHRTGDWAEALGL